MSWNGSNQSKTAASRPGGQSPAAKSENSGLTYFLIFIIVVAVAAVAAYFALRGEPKPAPAPKDISHSGKIAEVAPAVVKPQERPKKTAPLTAEEKRLKEIEEIEARYAGKKMPSGIATHLYYLKHPPRITLEAKGPNDFLRHPCEQEIASLLLAVPGTFFLVQPTFSESFDNDFVMALVDRIEILPDDDERTRRVKEEVSALKKEISRISREEGRRPSELMNEYARQMYELGQYERELTIQLNEAENDARNSDEDVEDFYNAANILLEKKGLGQIPIPDLTRRAIRLKKEFERKMQSEGNQ